MPRIPVLNSEKAKPEVQAVYEDFYQRMSFLRPPNFIMSQGDSLSVAKGTWGLVRSILVEGEIPRWTKEMVFVALSKDRGCRCCTAAHIACCRMLGVSRSSALSERKGRSQLSAAGATLRRAVYRV